MMSNNNELAKYAKRYIDIYEHFRQALIREGMEFAEDNLAERQAILTKIERKDIEFRNNSKSLCLNRLSKACEDCREGYSSATFILTLDCNRNCYFCSNRNQQNYEESLGKVFDISKEYEAYVDSGMKLTSVAVTGGEPLLHTNKCIEFYKKVKRTNKKTHTRLYTNGDLLTEESLIELSKYLNEIRISSKEDNGSYDLVELRAKLELCKKYINEVTVELPVMPDSFSEMKKLLDMLEDAEIFSVNLLEFLFPWQNAQEYVEKGYKIKNRPYKVLYKYNYAGGLPVNGSEETALELMSYAADNDFKIGVHYCSLENKLTSQIFQQNFLTKKSALEVFDEKDFFIKTAKTFGADALKIRNILDENNSCYYTYDTSSESIEFRIKDLPLLQNSSVEEVGISYLVTENNGLAKFLREIHFELINIQEVFYEHD